MSRHRSQTRAAKAVDPWHAHERGAGAGRYGDLRAQATTACRGQEGWGGAKLISRCGGGGSLQEDDKSRALEGA